MTAPRPDVRSLVDRYLAGTKRLLMTRGAWQPEARAGVYRRSIPIATEGEVLGHVELKAYPRDRQPAFRIVLIFLDRCIARLDSVPTDGPHYNSFNRPRDLEAGPVVGPHFHSWPDNCRFGTMSALPERLLNARPLRPKIRSYDAAFRWFCAEHNIDMETWVPPELPERDTLL